MDTPKKKMRGASGGGTSQSTGTKKKVPGAPPGSPPKTTEEKKKQTKLRAALNKVLPEAEIRELLRDDPSAIVSALSSFKSLNQIDNLETALAYYQDRLMKRVVATFDPFIRDNKLPSEEQIKSLLDPRLSSTAMQLGGPDDEKDVLRTLTRFFKGQTPAMAPDIGEPTLMKPAEPTKKKLVDVTSSTSPAKPVPGSPGGAETSSGTPTMEDPAEEMKEEEDEDETPRTPPAQTPRAEPPPTATSSSTSQSEPTRRREEPFVLPTAIDSIPPARLSSSFKTVAELNSDIRYFLKNFASILKPEAAAYKKLDKKSLPLLIRFHSRIVGKLSPSVNSETGRKIGVVLDAKAYIESEVKRLMQESTFSQMRPDDVVVDVGQNDPEQKDVKDIGDFEVKRSADGGLSSRRESIYRYAPTEGDPAVGLQGKSAKQKKKPRRLNMLPAEQINQSTTAQRLVKQNPFLRSDRRTNRLIYLS